MHVSKTFGPTFRCQSRSMSASNGSYSLISLPLTLIHKLVSCFYKYGDRVPVSNAGMLYPKSCYYNELEIVLQTRHLRCSVTTNLHACFFHWSACKYRKSISKLSLFHDGLIDLSALLIMTLNYIASSLECEGRAGGGRVRDGYEVGTRARAWELTQIVRHSVRAGNRRQSPDKEDYVSSGVNWRNRKRHE